MIELRIYIIALTTGKMIAAKIDLLPRVLIQFLEEFLQLQRKI